MSALGTYCTGCHRDGLEVSPRASHHERVLCDACAARPFRVNLSGLEFIDGDRGARCQTPIGDGTLAPPVESPGNTGDSGVPTRGTPGTLRKCDVAGMLTTEPEPVDWVIEGVVARGTLTLLAGREKEGKSLLAMACAARGASGGGELAGIHVEPMRALVIDAENGSRELHRRLRSLGLRTKHAPHIEVYEANAHDLRRHLHEVEAVLADFQPDLLILDSWRSLWGGDENDAGEVARVLDPLRNLVRRHNAGAVLIHHMRKGGGYRGSTAIGSSVENVLELSRHDEDPDRRRRRLRNPSCRYEQEVDDRWLRIEADRDRGLLLIDETEAFHPSAGARDDAAEGLLASLNGHPTTWAQWARDAGLDPKNGTARRARDELRKQGVVIQGDDGMWVAHAPGPPPVHRPPCSCERPTEERDDLGRCQRCWGVVA